VGLLGDAVASTAPLPAAKPVTKKKARGI
jgi:hypothetical protein